MGTTEIFAAVASDYEGFYKDHTYKVVQMSPCTITADYFWTAFNAATVNLVKAVNIFEIGGPTWYDTAPKIKNILGMDGF